jgi:hypothetical protein
MILAEMMDLNRLQESLQRLMNNAVNLQFPGRGDFVGMAEGLGLFQAAVLLLIGGIYLVYGYRVFQALVIVNAAIIGLLLGMHLGQYAHAPLAGALIGGIALAILAWPLLKAAVVIMSGLAGAAVGYAVWASATGNPSQAWMGGLIGLVAFGALALLLFKPTIMLLTSVQGAILAGAGILGLLFLNDSIRATLAAPLAQKPFYLEIGLICLTAIGFIFQAMSSAARRPPAPAARPPD